MTVRRNWLTSVVCASVLVSFGLVFLDRGKEDFGDFEELDIEENGKIVAFSFLKQIEIESEEFRCEENVFGANLNQTKAVKNRMWTRINGTNVFVYSAYQDRRLHPYDYLRIIAMVKGLWQNPLFCQISSGSGQRIVRANPIKIWTKTWNLNDSHIYYNPYLISCSLPLNETVSYFSITTTPCQKNAQILKVAQQKKIQTKNAFTVCLKSLNFDYDISKKILQWTLINKILGASKFVFYIENVVSKTAKLLRNLQKQYPELVEFKKHRKLQYEFNISEAVYIWQKRRYEIINYNDCLYRNLHTSQFVVPIDLDEIIVPRKVSSWSQLFEENQNFASFSVRNAYYLRQFNSNRKKKIFFFDYDTRSEYSAERESGKSFVSTENALTIFNHYALRSLKPGVGRIKFLKKEDVQMNHYKENCDIVILPECAKYLSSPVGIKDDLIFKYKKQFLGEYKQWLQAFNFTL